MCLCNDWTKCRKFCEHFIEILLNKDLNYFQNRTNAHHKIIPEMDTRIDEVPRRISGHVMYTVKNVRVVDILQQICYRQADIRMRSHRLPQLVNYTVASGQKT